MVSMSSIIYQLLTAPVIAQAGGNDTHALSWGLVLFSIFLGVSVALLPARRTSEIRRPKDD